jgi:fatty acid-binding protein DegV
MPLAVGYSGLSDEVLQKYLRDSAKLWEGQCEEVPSYVIGSTIGTHVGPNAVAVAFFAKK